MYLYGTSILSICGSFLLECCSMNTFRALCGYSMKYSFRTAHCAADEKGLLQASLFETSVESVLILQQIVSILIIGRYYNQ